MTDISGAWLGTYWQRGDPTRFEATLVQGGNTLSGSILDDCNLGEAQVSGEVVGRSIQFVKQYLTSSPTPIRYVGTIAEDDRSMRGTWSIAGRESGEWEAHRTGDNLLAELQERQAKELSLTGV